MSEPLLTFREVDVFYGVIQALKQVSLEVNKGETVALIGANGAGKSTLLMSIFGQPRIRSGQILFCGEDISHQSTHYVASGGIAQAPEGRRIFPDMTVEENLLMGLSRFPAREAREVPSFIYELFPVLEQMKQRRGGDLSGGQQQQLAIGRALASRPRLLILDEPTEGIQPSVIKEIGAVIRRLAERGDMAILLVEQFYDFAEELADQYLVMARGEIIQRGRGENMQAEGVRGLVTI